MRDLPPAPQVWHDEFHDNKATFEPVRTVADLLSLDQTEITRGYTDWISGDPEPGGNQGRAYWHGWCNRARDAGEMPHSDADAQLAHEITVCGILRDTDWSLGKKIITPEEGNRMLECARE